MKKIASICLAGTLLGMSAFAQEVKPIAPESSDYLPLLKAAGYEVYAYDISSLKDETYFFSVEIQEYVNGELVVPDEELGFTFSFTNRDMLSNFPEDQQEKIKAEGRAYDVEKGIYRLYTKMTVGFVPTSESEKSVALFFDGSMRYGTKLKLKEAAQPGYEGRYMYDVRPVKVEAFQPGTFIPLAVVGSYWFDERVGAFRFCGENEFPADLQSETLKLVPHYFVVGVRITK